MILDCHMHFEAFVYIIFYIEHKISTYNVKYIHPTLNLMYFICFRSTQGQTLKESASQTCMHLYPSQFLIELM